jgi:hypothetical protein
MLKSLAKIVNQAFKKEEKKRNNWVFEFIFSSEGEAQWNMIWGRIWKR